MKYSIENKLAVGVGVAVMVLVGMGILSYYAVSRQLAGAGWVLHTQQVIAVLDMGLATLTDAESKQRGFLLTGDEQLLKDSREAQRQIVSWIDRVRVLAADNPEQLRRLRRVQALITDRLVLLNRRAETRQALGLEGVAKDSAALRAGDAMTDRIWNAVVDMRSEEERLLTQREAAARSSVRLCLAMIISGGAVACATGLLAFTSTRRDLRLRAKAQRQVQESEMLMQSILDNLPALVFIKDLQGRYLFVNRQFAKVAGQPRAAIEGKTVYEIARKELAEASDTHFQTILKTGNPVETEETVLYPNGPRPHMAVKFPVRDPAGHINAVAGVSWDVTERKQAENLRLQFQTLFESAPGAYLVLKPDFTIVAASNAFLQATMTERSAIMNRNLFEVFPENPATPETAAVANVRESLTRVLRTAATDTMPIQKYDIRRPDGVFEERYWSIINSPILAADGRVDYIIHRVEDVTGFVQKKQSAGAAKRPEARERMETMEAEIYRSSEEVKAINEKLRAAYQEMESFSYSVSHDLRSPLRHIDGFIGLLKKQSYEKLDERGRRYLDIVGGAAKQMGMLIDDLLVFSRMGRTALRKTRVESDAVVSEAVAAARAGTEQRAIEWKIASLPEVVADPAMLRQVWINLISNAVKYSRSRNPAEIEIGCNDVDHELVFFVRDNGVGFDMQYAHKLFGVFQRLHRAEEYEGTGIGLANVRRIVLRHGGRTWAESKPDAGATFYFSLPKQN